MFQNLLPKKLRRKSSAHSRNTRHHPSAQHCCAKKHRCASFYVTSTLKKVLSCCLSVFTPVKVKRSFSENRYSCNQSRQASWPAGCRRERLWDTGIFFRRNLIFFSNWLFTVTRLRTVSHRISVKIPVTPQSSSLSSDRPLTKSAGGLWLRDWVELIMFFFLRALQFGYLLSTVISPFQVVKAVIIDAIWIVVEFSNGLLELENFL